MYVFYRDRSRKTWGQVDRFEGEASRVLTAAIASGRLERDRSIADGRLKHQRTERTIEHVFDLLTCPLWIRNWDRSRA
jgi:hypothetical protein